jgi:hypothetical protein
MSNPARREAVAGGVNSLEDGDLVRRLARGDAEALACVYDRYGALAHGNGQRGRALRGSTMRWICPTQLMCGRRCGSE